VQFEDGDETKLTANMIADAKGRYQYVLLEALIDHRCNDNVVKLADQMTVQANGKSYQRRSTAGWQICCQWRDGSTSWQNLCLLKESHPVERLNIPRATALTMNQRLTGGYITSSQNAITSYLW
jgi:hypothetical protein